MPGVIYTSVTGKFTAPSTIWTAGVGMYLSGELGRQWFGTTDFLRHSGVSERYQVSDYTTWNVGIGWTYKVFTLDPRYSGTT